MPKITRITKGKLPGMASRKDDRGAGAASRQASAEEAGTGAAAQAAPCMQSAQRRQAEMGGQSAVRRCSATSEHQANPQQARVRQMQIRAPAICF